MSTAVSQTNLRRALARVALLRYFPRDNPEALATVAELLLDLCSDDERLARAVNSVMREFSEWTGPAEFQRMVAYSLYPLGMWRLGGKWVPSPENGPEHDIIYADGSRHWHDGAYYDIPRKPRSSAEVAA